MEHKLTKTVEHKRAIIKLRTKILATVRTYGPIRAADIATRVNYPAPRIGSVIRSLMALGAITGNLIRVPDNRPSKGCHDVLEYSVPAPVDPRPEFRFMRTEPKTESILCTREKTSYGTTIVRFK